VPEAIDGSPHRIRFDVATGVLGVISSVSRQPKRLAASGDMKRPGGELFNRMRDAPARFSSVRLSLADNDAIGFEPLLIFLENYQ